MSPKVLLLGVAVVAVALAGCQKKAEAPVVAAPKPITVEVVKEAERSRSFLAVNKHLELGGTLYGYVDVDGDILKLTGGLHDALTQIATVQPAVAPYANQDFNAIAATLGLTDIKAVGLSSVPDGTGFFRNRVFFYTPGERHGLMLGLGGKPGPFTHLKYAPADTAFFAEGEVDVPVVYRTLKDVVAKVAGEPVGNQMEAALRKVGEKAAFSVLDLINGMKGHSSIILRVDPERTIKIPAPNSPELPAFTLLVCIDGIAPAVEPALSKSPLFKRTEEGTLHIYEFAQPSPVKEIQPVIVADGTTLFFTTSREFLNECRTRQTGLAQSPDFLRATTGIGTEGNGISYVHPRLFDALRRVETLNPSLPPQAKTIVSAIAKHAPKIDRPMAAIRTNLPDGILVRSYWDRSLKQEVAMIAVYNPVSIGLVAAMAIPAFQKVRASSQEKAIMNNLRQLSAAADQYYLEKGVTTTTFEVLVGPDKYIKRIQPVMGENYRQLRFVQGQPLRLRLPNGKTISYP